MYPLSGSWAEVWSVSDIDLDAASHDFRQDIGTVADKTDGEGAAFAAGGLAERERFIEVFADGVAVAECRTRRSMRLRVNIDGEERRRRSCVTDKGWAPPIPPMPPVTIELAV